MLSKMWYGKYQTVKVRFLHCDEWINWTQVGLPTPCCIITYIIACAASCLCCIGMSSSVSVCDTQWEQSCWLFSVYLPASSCSVPVLRKPVLQPRRPGRHNTTACEREGHWNRENEWETLRQRRGKRERERKGEGHAEWGKIGDRDVGNQSERGWSSGSSYFW